MLGVLEDFQEYFSLINFFLKSEELQTFPGDGGGSMSISMKQEYFIEL